MAIEKAHMVIPPACAGLPAGQPAPPGRRRHGRQRTGLLQRRGKADPGVGAKEDGPNLRRTTPKSPVRVARGRTRLLPADWAPGGHQCPEELPWPSRVSLERVSSYDPKAAEPHRRNGGWRHPPPSGSPSGPVGPCGRNSNPDFPVQPRRPLGAKRNLEGGRVRVKAMFPLARRVCPAQNGRTTSMELGDAPSLGLTGCADSRHRGPATDAPPGRSGCA